MISPDSESEAQSDLADIYHGILRDDLSMLKQGVEANTNINMTFKGDSNLQHIGMTPLALAAALNKISALKYLLDHGANVNDTFASLRTTALMTASFHGHARIVEVLLKGGANVQAIDLQGSTALGYAFGGSRSVEVIEFLLRSGVNINQKNMLGMNALLLVAGYGDDKLVRMVLDTGADSNSINDFGHSALHLVIVGKRSQLKKLAQDGTGNKITFDNFNNLKSAEVALKDWAARNKHVTVDSRKLEKAANLMSNIGCKLQRAHAKASDDSDQEVIKQRVEAVWLHRQEKLMASKKSIRKSGKLESLLCAGRKGKEQEDSQPYLAMPTRSSKRMNTERDKEISDLRERFGRILMMIADAGCDVKATEKTFGMTALDMAILLEDVESTGVLVARGADPEHLLKMFALSDLHEAIVSGDKRLVEKLLSYDTDLDINHHFSTFNVDAKQVENEEEEAGEFILSDGVTPLAVAAQMPEDEGHACKIVKILLKNKAEVNKMGPGGSTALMEACRVGNVVMAQMLIAHGADVNLPCPRYNQATPIVITAIYSRNEVAQLLSDKGAKLDIQTTDGRCALTEAYRNENMRIVEIVLRGSLGNDFSDKNSFTYEMVVKYQRPDKNMNTIMKMIGDEVKQQDEDRRAKDIAARKKQSMGLLRRVSEPSVTDRQKFRKADFESENNNLDKDQASQSGVAISSALSESTLLENSPKQTRNEIHFNQLPSRQDTTGGAFLRPTIGNITNSQPESVKLPFPSFTNSLNAHKNALYNETTSKAVDAINRYSTELGSTATDSLTAFKKEAGEKIVKPVSQVSDRLNQMATQTKSTCGSYAQNASNKIRSFNSNSFGSTVKAPLDWHQNVSIEHGNVKSSYEEDWEDETGFQEQYYPASCLENGEACLMTTPILGRCTQVRHNFAQSDSYLRDVMKTGNFQKFSPRSAIRTIDDENEDLDTKRTRKSREGRPETDI